MHQQDQLTATQRDVLSLLRHALAQASERTNESGLSVLDVLVGLCRYGDSVNDVVDAADDLAATPAKD